MRRTLPALLLGVSVGLAVAGVTAAVVRLGRDGPPSDPRAAVVRALSRLPGGGSDSARYLVRYALEASGQRREVGTFEGTADFRRQRFLARARFVPEGGDPRELDVFVFGRWQYERSPGEPGWGRRFLQPQNFGTPTPELVVVGRRGGDFAGPAYRNDEELRRQIVDALAADVVLVGRDDQRATPAWHYRVTLDPGRAAGLLPEPVRSEMRSWSEGDDRRDVDVWLDGRGRLRRVSIFFADEEGWGPHVENEFWDFGEPGRIDLPSDLQDPTAVGGEGTTSFTASSGTDLDLESPGFSVSVFSPDQPGDTVTLGVEDSPNLGAADRRRTFRIRPPAGGPLERGDYRLVDRREFSRNVPSTFVLNAPEVDERCPEDRPRSGRLSVVEAVRYEDRYYVRLHVTFTVECQPPGGAAPVSVRGDVRYYALT